MSFFFWCAQDLVCHILCDPLPRSCAAHRIRQTISCAQPATSCAPHRISGPNSTGCGSHILCAAQDLGSGSHRIGPPDPVRDTGCGHRMWRARSRVSRSCACLILCALQCFIVRNYVEYVLQLMSPRRGAGCTPPPSHPPLVVADEFFSPPCSTCLAAPLALGAN